MQKSKLHLFSLTALLLSVSVSAQTPQDLGPGAALFEKGQFAEALGPLKEKAEQGNAEAQYRVGWMYQTGKGTEANNEVAIVWYKKAANQGHLSAQNNLCSADLSAQNFQEAAVWCDKAANQNHPKAQFLLAMMYLNGQGFAKDEAKSAQWLLKSAQQGYAASQYKLGFFYKEGVGVAKDREAAKKYWEQAAAQNYKNAADHLRCLNSNGLPESECNLPIY